ncbi:hypothetical protein [Nocardioides halotolerans]|jgi:hypothetical protein|uniref:hypothetical protein n=1 Tax=Nocardioides halotolerans TaxID=433660 RepID=UPI00042A2EC5|nr:hypothetical protein [Nocardioides halotolerans]
MSLIRTSLSIIATMAAVAVPLATGAPAHAEDQRACVSKREFFGARQLGIVIPPGRDWLSRVPPPSAKPVGRLTIEDRWDVRRRGVTVTQTLDRVRVGVNPLVRVKMYRSCEQPLTDLQVYVGFHKDTNLVLWTMWWPTRAA